MQCADVNDVIASATAYTEAGIITHPLHYPGEATGEDAGTYSGKEPVKSKWQLRTEPTNRPDLEFSKKGNIGFLCGKASNLMTVDIDYSYPVIVHTLIGDGKYHPKCDSNFVKVQHAADRWHWHFQHEAGVKVGQFGWFGFDVLGEDSKGRGDNCVAPPSIHKDGSLYEFVQGKIEDRPRMPDFFKDNLKMLIDLHGEFDACVKRCRPWVMKFLDECLRKKGGRYFHNVSVFHGADGRARTLALLSEMKANGASDMVLRVTCTLIFDKESDDSKINKELPNVHDKPPKADTLRADTIIRSIATDDDFKLRNAATVNKADPMQSATGTTGKMETQELVMYIGDLILARTHMFTMADTSEFYIYTDGVFTPDTAKSQIKELIRRRTEEYYSMVGCPKTASKYFVSECIDYIESRTHISRESLDVLWRESDFINFKNGMYKLSTRTLLPHAPEFFSIVQFPVIFDPAATCPEIDRFLQSCGLDDGNIATLTEFAGLCLTPDVSFEKALLLHGTGSNGKTVVLNLLKTIIGRANFSSESLHSMSKPFRLANLYGKSANVFPDLKGTKVEDLEPFMISVGGDSELTGEKKYQNTFTFHPTAKIVVSANKPPSTHADHTAYYRRWLIIPFTKKFDLATKDRKLIRRLTTEAEKSGFLNAILEGLHRLHERDRFTTEHDITATAIEYRMLSDPIAVFVDEKCTECSDSGGPDPKQVIFNCFVNWCSKNEIEPGSLSKFGRRLKDLGYPAKDYHGKNEPHLYFYENLRLKETRQSNIQKC